MGATQASVAFQDSPDPGDSVLVLSPTLDDETDRKCTDLLTLDQPEETHVLWITMHEPPQDRIDIWEHHCDTLPVTGAVIGIGTDMDIQRNTTSPRLGGEQVPVSRINSPQDLTKLGVAVVDQLEEWSGSDTDDIVICFHSLSTFLQYVDLQKAFKFLHALTVKIPRHGAIAHFHMDPEVHDDKTISTLLPLFRSVAEYESGEWSYRSR